MLAGIRTKDLRKVYSSAPPLAAGGGGFSFAATRGKGKQPKPQIVALDGISLDVTPGEIFCLLGPNGAGKSTTVGVLTTRVRPTGGQAWIGFGVPILVLVEAKAEVGFDWLAFVLPDVVVVVDEAVEQPSGRCTAEAQ